VKNLRQLLRRPVGNCDAEIWDEEHEDGRYTVYVKCIHLKEPRQQTLVGVDPRDPASRKQVWDDMHGDLETHMRYSDPW
jgi:hypothetical protein